MKTPTELQGEIETAAWKWIAATYKLDDEGVKLTAVDYCRSCQIIADADVAIRQIGLVVTSEKGAMYQNPAVGIRNKSTTHRLRCLESLEPHKRQDGGQDDLPVMLPNKPRGK